MRDYQTKANVGAGPDSITVTKYGAGEFNSLAQELENTCTRAGLTLAPNDGTDEKFTQLAESLFINGVKSTTFQAAGTVDAITLTPVSGASGVFIPADYNNLEGARITFEPTGANTGAVTVSIGQTGGTQLGTKKLFNASGVDFTGGELSTDRIEIIFDEAADSGAGAWILTPWAISSAQVIPQNHFAGLILSPDAGDPDHDINVTAGQASDSTNASFLTLASEITKQIDATWVAGDDVGGLFTGTVAANTTYHFFEIEKDSDGSIDAGFDTSVVAANIPAGYTKFRRLGPTLTDASANIIAFIQEEDDFRWVTPVIDIDDQNPGTAAVTRTLTLPTGIIINADLMVGNFSGTNAHFTTYMSALDQTDSAPQVHGTAALTGVGNLSAQASGSAWEFNSMKIFTNTSAQVRSRNDISGANDRIGIITNGWTDTRGK